MEERQRGQARNLIKRQSKNQNFLRAQGTRPYRPINEDLGTKVTEQSQKKAVFENILNLRAFLNNFGLLVQARILEDFFCLN